MYCYKTIRRLPTTARNLNRAIDIFLTCELRPSSTVKHQSIKFSIAWALYTFPPISTSGRRCGQSTTSLVMGYEASKLAQRGGNCKRHITERCVMKFQVTKTKMLEDNASHGGTRTPRRKHMLLVIRAAHAFVLLSSVIDVTHEDGFRSKLRTMANKDPTIPPRDHTKFCIGRFPQSR